MKLRRVRLPEGAGFSVAILHGDEWAPLRPAIELQQTRGQVVPAELAAECDDIVAFLQGGTTLRDAAADLLMAVQPLLTQHHRDYVTAPQLPFQPLSFRDFMLYER